MPQLVKQILDHTLTSQNLLQFLFPFHHLFDYYNFVLFFSSHPFLFLSFAFLGQSLLDSSTSNYIKNKYFTKLGSGSLLSTSQQSSFKAESNFPWSWVCAYSAIGISISLLSLIIRPELLLEQNYTFDFKFLILCNWFVLWPF